MEVDILFNEGVSKEDTYLAKDNIFGVFDGANNAEKFRDSKGKTGGLIASLIVKEEFLKDDADLEDLAIRANRKIAAKMKEEGINNRDVNAQWTSTAAVVRFQKAIENSFEWLQIGDSAILLIFDDNSIRLLFDNYDLDREPLLFMKRLIEQGKDEKEAQELRREIAPKFRRERNVKYGILNGEEKLSGFIKTGVESLSNVKHILLFTDGLFLPREDPLREHDWQKFVSLYLKGGLKNVRDFVRELENKDSECRKYPRFKQHDDIAAISLSFSP